MQENRGITLLEKPLIQSLIVGITPAGSIDVSRVDKLGINLEIKKFKKEGGGIDYPALFSIPKDQRIAALSQRDLESTIKIIAVALTMCFETMNLSRPMQAFQILDLAEIIVDEANTTNDSISLEDLMLFIQRLSRGEYSGFYEGMDIPKFMERFNQYRDERWQKAIELRNEREEEFKRLGDANTFERENPTDGSPFGKYMNHLRLKYQAKSDERKSRKK